MVVLEDFAHAHSFLPHTLHFVLYMYIGVGVVQYYLYGCMLYYMISFLQTSAILRISEFLMILCPSLFLVVTGCISM
jgi:hypothetical protein